MRAFNKKKKRKHTTKTKYVIIDSLSVWWVWGQPARRVGYAGDGYFRTHSVKFKKWKCNGKSGRM